MNSGSIKYTRDMNNISSYSDEHKKIAFSFHDSDSLDFHEFIQEIPHENNFSDEQSNFLNACKKYQIKLQRGRVVVNQHYVPQFYLKSFASPEYSPNFKLETWDAKKHSILKAQSVRSVCQEMYFYWVETGKYDFISQVVEDFFKYFEMKFWLIYPSLVDEILTSKHLDADKIRELCAFCSTLWMRWKAFRNQTSRMKEDIYKDMTKSMYQIRNKELLTEAEKIILSWDYDLDFNNSDHLKFITNEHNVYMFASQFFRQRIRIYIAKWSRNFVTSDNPVVHIFKASNMKGFFTNAFSKRLSYIALHPKVLIEFDEYPGPFREIWKKPIRKEIYDDEVTYYNFIRLRYSNFLYSNSKDNLIAEEYNIAWINNIDTLVDIMHSDWIDQQNTVIEKYKKIAKTKWLTFKNNYEMLGHFWMMPDWIMPY